MAIAAGLVLLATFTLIERRTRDPIVPRRLLANRPLIIAVVIAFMFMATFGSLLYFLSIYFQDVRCSARVTGIGNAKTKISHWAEPRPLSHVWITGASRSPYERKQRIK
jgi:uncharacterized membrane protein YedE/YeeE